MIGCKAIKFFSLIFIANLIQTHGQPVISSVAPLPYGFLIQNAIFTITGTGFGSGATVTLNPTGSANVAANLGLTVQSSTATQIVAVSPATGNDGFFPKGTVTMTVTYGGQVSSPYSLTFQTIGNTYSGYQTCFGYPKSMTSATGTPVGGINSEQWCSTACTSASFFGFAYSPNICYCITAISQPPDFNAANGAYGSGGWYYWLINSVTQSLASISVDGTSISTTYSKSVTAATSSTSVLITGYGSATVALSGATGPATLTAGTAGTYILATGSNTITVTFVSNCGYNAPITTTYTITITKAAAVHGDPVFQGFYGQTYQVHGIPGSSYNLLSFSVGSLQYFLTGKFEFLSSGRDFKQIRNYEISHYHTKPSKSLLTKIFPITEGWTHPGSYITNVGFSVCSAKSQNNEGCDEYRFEAGSYGAGFSVFVNDSPQTEPSDETNDNSNYDNDKKLTAKVDQDLEILISARRVSISNNNHFNISIVCSDYFANLSEIMLSENILESLSQSSGSNSRFSAGLIGISANREMVSLKKDEIDSCSLGEDLFAHP